MDLALKYRIVGAIVLVSLAVIFVPIVLDGSGHESADGSGHRQNIRSDLNIPPEPEFIDEQPAVRAGWKQQMGPLHRRSQMLMIWLKVFILK